MSDVRCHNCNMLVPTGAFCSHCGSPLQPGSAASPVLLVNDQPSALACPGCGSAIEAGQQICERCSGEGSWGDEIAADAAARKGKLLAAGGVGALAVLVVGAVLLVNSIQEAKRQAHLESAEAAATEFAKHLSLGNASAVSRMAGPSFFDHLRTSCNAMRHCGAPPRNMSRDIASSLRNGIYANYSMCVQSAADRPHEECTVEYLEREFLDMVRNVHALVGDCQVKSVSWDEAYAMGSDTDESFVTVGILCGERFGHAHLSYSVARDKWFLHGVPEDWMLAIRHRVIQGLADIERERKERFEALLKAEERAERRRHRYRRSGR